MLVGRRAVLRNTSNVSALFVFWLHAFSEDHATCSEVWGVSLFRALVLGS